MHLGVFYGLITVEGQSSKGEKGIPLCRFLSCSTVGLLKSAAIVSTQTDDVLCPDADHTPVPTTGDTESGPLFTTTANTHRKPTEPAEHSEPVTDPIKVAASSVLLSL